MHAKQMDAFATGLPPQIESELNEGPRLQRRAKRLPNVQFPLGLHAHFGTVAYFGSVNLTEPPRRELLRRIKRRFHELGIETSMPTQLVLRAEPNSPTETLPEETITLPSRAA